MGKPDDGLSAKEFDVTILTTNGERSIRDIFRQLYGIPLPPDSNPSEVRSRLLFVGEMVYMATREKIAAQIRGGTRETTIWNAILELLRRDLSIVESINMSICNERRVISSRT